MARSRRSPHFPLSVIASLVLVALALSYAGWRFHQYRQTSKAPSVVYFQPQDETPPPPGYTRFIFDDWSLGFVYAKSEDPIVVRGQPPAGAQARLKTRNFDLLLWPAAGFRYTPRFDKNRCVYDRALDLFVSEKAGQNCAISAQNVNSKRVFFASSQSDGRMEFAYLIPIKYHQHFLEFQIRYTSECVSNPAIYGEVCETRANDQHTKLHNFIVDFTARNPDLLR